MVLGSEDFTSLLTSCLVCVVKNEPEMLDHLISWGFLHTLVTLLKRSIDTNR